jgi:hypothetical protein
VECCRQTLRSAPQAHYIKRAVSSCDEERRKSKSDANSALVLHGVFQLLPLLHGRTKTRQVSLNNLLLIFELNIHVILYINMVL